MMKRVVLCIIGGVFVLVLIAGIFQVGQRHDVKELTWREELEALKIAFEDARMKEMVKGNEYGISYVNLTSEEQMPYPMVVMWVLQEGEWANKVEIIVDLNEKKVLNIREKSHFKQLPPRGVVGEEREQAIKIALDNKFVKEKIDGLVYEIPWVDEIREESEIKKERPGERLAMVNIGIVGANIVYIVTVSLTEGKVIRITEAYWGGKIAKENEKKAKEIAKNDSRVREIIFEGRSEWRELKGFVIEYMCRDRVVGGKLLVDVYIHRESPEPERFILTTVDLEEGKVIVVKEVSSMPTLDYKVIYQER